MSNKTKKISQLEILYLDEIGYGPEGRQTRREWRKECLDNLFAGREHFVAWQNNCLTKQKEALKPNYGLIVRYSDGSAEKVFDGRSAFGLDFVGNRFAELNATNFDFLIPAIFNYATFTANAGFDNAIFMRGSAFNNATFEGNARFANVTFEMYAEFSNVTFEKHTGFNNATFKGGANFSMACFPEGAAFGMTTFKERAGFENATFKAVTHFSNATFEKGAWFNKAKFKWAVSFRKSSFIEEAEFSNVTFERIAVFTDATFDSTSKFYDAKFLLEADFENATFSNVGHFERAVFLAYVPAFRGCKIDSTRLEFSDDKSFPDTDFTEDAIKNISFLKRLSDEHGQTDQALNFNAMELRAKRGNARQLLAIDGPIQKLLDGKYWFCLFTWLYEVVSDFGRSFTRPLFLLLGLMAISYLFGVVSAFENSPAKLTHSIQPIFTELSRVYIYPQKSNENKYVPISAYRAAMEYSLYRSGNFLDFTDADKNTASINMRLFGSEVEPIWARFFGFIKGICTAILLFLIALGLRNKYRVS